MKKELKKINEKHKLFCEKYVSNNCKGTKAYMEAYNNKNYHASAISATRLLTEPLIIQYIEELKKGIRVKFEIDQDFFVDKYKNTFIFIENYMNLLQDNKLDEVKIAQINIFQKAIPDVISGYLRVISDCATFVGFKDADVKKGRPETSENHKTLTTEDLFKMVS